MSQIGPTSEPAGELGCLEKRLLGALCFSAPLQRASECQKQVAARPLVGDRCQPRPVQPCGFLVGQQAERPVSGSLGVTDAGFGVASGEGVLGERGQLRSRIVGADLLEYS